MTTERRLARLAALLVLVGWASSAAGGGRPAVLFLGGAHSRYVVRPLREMGIEVDACKAGQFAERLATGKLNVVVAGTMNEADRTAATAFLAKGGGVLVCSPHAWSETKNWTATNQWLADLGARPRWEVLQDGDKANVVRDVMRCALSWSDQVAPPVDDGVRGVLTLLWSGTTGCEPPMPFDVSDEWKTVVRGAASMSSRPSKRHDEYLQPWKPKEPLKESPPLMAFRQVGKGRLGVLAIRYYWLFTPPSNCPTAEAMLTKGTGGKPSDWLRVCANAFRWLAEPSMKAGTGGATTPAELLDPPVKVWPTLPPRDWTKHKAVAEEPDQPQAAGLIGARTALSSGNGTVADYAKAAQAAGLQFIVFLEDSLKMNAAAWQKLVEACAAASGKEFAAVPGLTYEDAQGNHLYAFADEVKFPKPDMLLPDGRLATNRSNRTKAYFDYVNELMRQKIISGLWNHKANQLHPADYKLYNSFPIVSAIDGKQVDDALSTYQYFMGIGGCQAPLALEIMTSPDQVAKRAKDGWRVVAHRSPSDLRTKWHHGAWSFSGSGSQYITNGPRILLWRGPNRLILPRGEWWRPDLWQFRVAMRVSSDAGLKSVVLYDGERVFRRWLPKGAKTFETELVLANCQQRGLYLIVEDVNGRKAVNAEFWSRNCIMEEFFCSDRCNFLGNCRLRTRDGRQTWTQVSFNGNMGITPSKGRLNLFAQPAVCLTLDSPTLPIDGRPMGFPTCDLRFRLPVPGELKHLFAWPVTHLVSPEIAVGQADYRLGYDPAEHGAEKTPLGHPYEQPQHGWGNSWGSWHKLVPTRKLSGWSRTYACNWLPGTFRIGWHETNVRLKEAVDLPDEGLQVMTTSMPGWVVRLHDLIVLTPEEPAMGDFGRGSYATLQHPGGSAIVIALEDRLTFHYEKGGRLSLWYDPGRETLKAGDPIQFRIGFAGAASGTTTAQMIDFARKFGTAQPGRQGYAPEILPIPSAWERPWWYTAPRRKEPSTCLVWRLDGARTGVRARVPQADLPGFLPTIVEGLNDRWSVWLLDKAREWPNVRALPVRDGRAFAQLDPAAGDLDIFIGHPVICDQANIRLLVSWMEPGLWFVEAHNPTDAPIKALLRSSEGWTPFAFRETVDLAPGTSRIWRVRGKGR
ncbi:hypothetical protein ACFL09_02200 [Planctomycetota bacterium]